ncbi:hypothetical protein NL676_006380 [Syzygium grande]|nr:hypothetical protein NL676_006380 [Syzygium grande]
MRFFPDHKRKHQKPRRRWRMDRDGRYCCKGPESRDPFLLEMEECPRGMMDPRDAHPALIARCGGGDEDGVPTSHPPCGAHIRGTSSTLSSPALSLPSKLSFYAIPK